MYERTLAGMSCPPNLLNALTLFISDVAEQRKVIAIQEEKSSIAKHLTIFKII